MNELLPIETAPKDGTWILLFGGEPDYLDPYKEELFPPCVVARWASNDSGNMMWRFAWYDSGYYGEYEWPTHWLPIPETKPQNTHGAADR